MEIEAQNFDDLYDIVKNAFPAAIQKKLTAKGKKVSEKAAKLKSAKSKTSRAATAKHKSQKRKATRVKAEPVTKVIKEKVTAVKKTGVAAVKNVTKSKPDFEPIYFKKNTTGNAYKIDKNEANGNGESTKNNKVENYKELLRMAFTEGDRIVPVLDRKEFKIRLQRLQNPKESKPNDATRKQADRAISFMFDNLLITTDGDPNKIKRFNTI